LRRRPPRRVPRPYRLTNPATTVIGTGR
jgi:hypothetical protein